MKIEGERGQLLYHYPSHPRAYPGGYLSHSLWVDVGLPQGLLIIQEMDAESGVLWRQAIFQNERGMDIVRERHARKDGKFAKEVEFFGGY